MAGYSEGTKVEWEWGGETGTGIVIHIYTQKITKEIKGSEVTREASDDEPAYLIEQDDGGEVLKGHGEVHKAG